MTGVRMNCEKSVSEGTAIPLPTMSARDRIPIGKPRAITRLRVPRNRTRQHSQFESAAEQPCFLARWQHVEILAKHVRCVILALELSQSIHVHTVCGDAGIWCHIA